MYILKCRGQRVECVFSRAVGGEIDQDNSKLKRN